MNEPDNRTRAEKAATEGTMRACWEAYDASVVQQTFLLAGLPKTRHDYVEGCRLDFYSGAAHVFMILRGMFERGVQPDGTIMTTLEAEVMTVLADIQKAGHA